MKESKIRIGIVGGNFGQTTLLPAFQLDPRCEIVGIATSSIDKSKQLSSQYNLPKFYKNWEELVLDKDLDAISIAVPPLLQSKIAMNALEQGKAVFAEKPLAARLEQAKPLCDVAIQLQLPNMVNFHLPTLSPWIKAKKMIDDSKIGKLQNIIIQYSGTASHDMLINNWRSLKDFGSGTLFDIVSHFFHALEWFAGPIIGLNAKLFSTIKDKPNRDIFDVLAIEFSSGASGSIIASKAASFGTSYKIDFLGNEGTLCLANKCKNLNSFSLFFGSRSSKELELICPSSLIENNNFVDSKIQVDGIVPVDGKIQSVGNLTKVFLDWIITGKAATPSFIEGVNVQRLLEAAYISDATGKWIKPSLPIVSS